jgi:hypothetical protein
MFPLHHLTFSQFVQFVEDGWLSCAWCSSCVLCCDMWKVDCLYTHLRIYCCQHVPSRWMNTGWMLTFVRARVGPSFVFVQASNRFQKLEQPRGLTPNPPPSSLSPPPAWSQVITMCLCLCSVYWLLLNQYWRHALLYTVVGHSENWARRDYLVNAWCAWCSSWQTFL